MKDDLSSDTNCLNEPGRILDDLESVFLDSLKDEKVNITTWVLLKGWNKFAESSLVLLSFQALLSNLVSSF